MGLLQNRSITCPYCGEAIGIQIDCSVPQQDYIEDCSVCCRPINIGVYIDNDDITLDVSHENE